MAHGRIKPDLGDLDILEILHRRYVLGQMPSEIAAETGLEGPTLRGMLARIKAANKNDAGIGDGSMPVRWWDTPRKKPK